MKWRTPAAGALAALLRALAAEAAPDGIIDESDIFFLETSPYPGNLPAGLTARFVSSQPGGHLPLGYDRLCTDTLAGCAADAECPAGTCSLPNTIADESLPLRSMQAASELFNLDGCGEIYHFDAGDDWRNEAIGKIAPLQLACASNDEVALVWAPYPMHGWVRMDYVFASSGEAPADVTGTADAPASTKSVLVDADHAGSWGVDAFAGAQLLALSGGNRGMRRDITANDATSISVASPFIANLDGDAYAVVAPTGTKRDHINLPTGDAGTFILIGFHIQRPYLDNVITCSAKDPSDRFAAWRLKLENDFVEVSPGPLMHFNSPTTSYLFQTRAIDVHRAVLNTSGNVLLVGARWSTAASHGAPNGYLARTTGQFDLVIDAVLLNRDPGAGASFVLWRREWGQQEGPLDAWMVRSILGGGIGRSFAWRASLPRPTSRLDLRFVSIVDGDVGLSAELGNGVERTLFLRGVAIDDSSDYQLSIAVLDGLTVDVRDSTVDLQGPSGAPFLIGAAASATFAGARAALGDVHCEGGDCDASFFPEQADLGFASEVGLSEDPADPADAVAWGTCHPAHDQCHWAATTDPIDFTVPRADEVPEATDDVCLPGWALPDGDTGCRYLLRAPVHRGGVDSGDPWAVPGLGGWGGGLLATGLAAGAARALRRRAHGR